MTLEKILCRIQDKQNIMTTKFLKDLSSVTTGILYVFQDLHDLYWFLNEFFR